MTSIQSRKRPFSLMSDKKYSSSSESLTRRSIYSNDSAADVLAEMKGDVEVWRDIQERLKSSKNTPKQLDALLQQQLDHTKESIKKVESLVKSCRERLHTLAGRNPSRASAPVFGCPTVEEDMSPSCHLVPNQRSSILRSQNTRDNYSVMSNYSASNDQPKRHKREGGSVLSRLNSFFSKFLKPASYESADYNDNAKPQSFNNHVAILSDHESGDDSTTTTSETDLGRPMESTDTLDSKEEEMQKSLPKEQIYIALDDDDEEIQLNGST